MTPHRNRDNYAQVTHNQDIHAWSQDQGHWMVVKDHSVCAELDVQTKRTRRDDLSGRKKFRIVTTHRITVTVRSSYRKEYTMDDTLFFYGGEVSAVRKVLAWFTSGHLFNIARMDAQIKTRKAGATDLQMIEADDIYDWRFDDRTDWENERLRLDKHVRLLESLQESNTLKG